MDREKRIDELLATLPWTLGESEKVMPVKIHFRACGHWCNHIVCEIPRLGERLYCLDCGRYRRIDRVVAMTRDEME